MRKGRLRCTTVPFPTVPNRGRWVEKTWNGLENISNKVIHGDRIWSDGTKIYYSYGDTQLVLNGNTWEPKVWNLVPHYGNNVWTDGENIYYTHEIVSGDDKGVHHYVLDNGVWKTKTWDVPKLTGSCVWSDDKNIYYTCISLPDQNYNYVLDNGVWKTKAWDGLEDLDNIFGSEMWSDGVNIYHSEYSHLVLNGNTWEPKEWEPIASGIFYGLDLWTDGIDLYHTSNWNGQPYVLHGDSWEKIDFNFDLRHGRCVWTDGVDIYYSCEDAQYVLERTQPQDLNPGSMLMGWLAGRAVAGQRLHVKQ